MRLLTALFIPAALLAQESNATLENPFTSDADIAAGEKVFQAQCAACHGLDGRGGAAGPDISHGNFKRVSSDEGLFQLINKGIPGTSMPPFPLNAQPAWRVVAYLRSLSRAKATPASIGDAARGASLYERSKCAGCHASGGGPNLAGIGARRKPQELRISIADSQVEVPSHYWRMRAVTNSGAVLSGLRLNEDTFTIQFRDAKGQLRSASKADLKSIELDRSSPMPTYKDKLSAKDLDDLTAFLAAGGPQ